jgi:hypothetical protein
LSCYYHKLMGPTPTVRSLRDQISAAFITASGVAIKTHSKPKLT